MTRKDEIILEINKLQEELKVLEYKHTIENSIMPLSGLSAYQKAMYFDDVHRKLLNVITDYVNGNAYYTDLEDVSFEVMTKILNSENPAKIFNLIDTAGF